MPEGNAAGKGQDCQRQGDQSQKTLGDEQDPAPVISICHRPADGGKQDYRQDTGQADPAQRERIGVAGQRADVPEEGRDLHLRSGDRNEQPQPQIEVPAVFERRRDVQFHSGDQVPQSRR